MTTPIFTESEVELEKIKWHNYRENTRYLWEDIVPSVNTKTKAELDEKYKDFHLNVPSSKSP